MPNPFADDSSLIHHVDLAVPGTHVIVLGIGHYDHLPDGGATTTKHHLNLKQLSSPPVSARKVAEWFIEKFDCQESPLGSVAVVLSEQQPAKFQNPKTGVEYVVPTGTMEEVRKALIAWMTRAEVSSRSRIVLYFCGHGLSSGSENLYLMRDYGKDDRDPLAGALNYQNFMSGLAFCKPSNQFFLFDACRSAEPIAALNRNGGQYVFAADPEGRLNIAEPMQQCPIFSTELDRKALGRPNEESLCARAFIRTMSGACCRREGNNWYVTTHRIQEALTDFQNRELIKAEVTDRQNADASRHAKIRLRQLPSTPRIPVFIRLDDKTFTPKARILVVRNGNPPQCISDPACVGWTSRDEWETELEIGDYKFLAEPLNNGKAPIAYEETVFPVFIEVTLKVSQWAG
jgi:Caspase domain